MTDLEIRFHDAMLNLCDQAKLQCNINFTRLRKMLANETGVQVAKKLVNSNEPSEGFIRLMEIDRKDLSVEELIQKDDWKSLFDEQTLNNARKKLAK